jgi:hypothetical protein
MARRRKRIKYSVFVLLVFGFLGWLGFTIITLVEKNQGEIVSAVAPTPEFEVLHHVKGSKLYLEFRINHFQLVKEKMGQKPYYGEGHILLYVDDKPVAHIYKSAYVYAGLQPGSHKIRVELVHNNNESYGIGKEFPIVIRSN